MEKEAVFNLFKKNCVDHPGNYEVTPGQALQIAKVIEQQANNKFITDLKDRLALGPNDEAGIGAYEVLHELIESTKE